jgi:hypothetical protein
MAVPRLRFQTVELTGSSGPIGTPFSPRPDADIEAELTTPQKDGWVIVGMANGLPGTVVLLWQDPTDPIDVDPDAENKLAAVVERETERRQQESIRRAIEAEQAARAARGIVDTECPACGEPVAYRLNRYTGELAAITQANFHDGDVEVVGPDEYRPLTAIEVKRMQKADPLSARPRLHVHESEPVATP